LAAGGRLGLEGGDHALAGGVVEADPVRPMDCRSPGTLSVRPKMVEAYWLPLTVGVVDGSRLEPAADDGHAEGAHHGLALDPARMDQPSIRGLTASTTRAT